MLQCFEGTLDRDQLDRRAFMFKHKLLGHPALSVQNLAKVIPALPANQVTGEQIAEMMRRVIERGKARTSNKLRSYIRAAFQVAKAVRSRPSIPVKFISVVSSGSATTHATTRVTTR